MPANTGFFDQGTGGSQIKVYPLPTSGTLVHVDVTMHDASAGPCRVSLAMQYNNDTANRGPIGDGPKWLRSSASFGVQDSIQWDGEIPLESPRHSLLVLVRNDTGETQTFRCTRVWRR